MYILTIWIPSHSISRDIVSGPEMIKNKLTFFISKTVHIESILSVIPEEKTN